MVKKFVKMNNNFLWAGAVIGAVLLFLYVGAVREGFQNAPTVQTGLPQVIPSSTEPQSVPSNTNSELPNAINTNSNTNPKPSISLVRSKLNELKTMVDNM